MNHDGPPPVEPPFDPDYDRPQQDRRPTQDIAAERAVLGALLLDPTQATGLALELEPGDFYRPEHEQIWNHAYALLAEGTPLDAITLAGRIASNGTGKLIAPTYVVDLMQACPNPASATWYARQVRDAARIRAIANAATRLRLLADKGDVDAIDHIMGEALQVLDDQALRHGPRNPHTSTGLADLTWVLAGQPPPQKPPVYGRRNDGTALFYKGRVNGIFGDPEAAKTWLGQIVGIEALNDGGTFAMIDVDHNGQDHTAARLMLLGAHHDHIADPDKFRYYEPEDADELRAAITEITQLAPDVVLLDSIGEMLPMLGVKSIDNDEITAALRLIAMPPAKAGSCVIHIDHLPKSHEARGSGYAIGGTAKKRATDGAYLRAEARTQPAPGAIGRITLRIEKDRTGELRKTSGGGYAGTFTLDSTEAHVTTWTIGREDSPLTPDGRFRPTYLMERISRFVEENDQVSFTQIKRSIEGQDKNLRAAIRVLVEEGFLSVIKTSKTHLHHSIAMYREAEDDQVQDAE